MSTVVELSEQELADLKSLTPQADAIPSAITEYLRFARRMHLKALFAGWGWKTIGNRSKPRRRGNSMATTELVLVETCIWVLFINRPRSRENAPLVRS